MDIPAITMLIGLLLMLPSGIWYLASKLSSHDHRLEDTERQHKSLKRDMEVVKSRLNDICKKLDKH